MPDKRLQDLRRMERLVVEGKKDDPEPEQPEEHEEEDPPQPGELEIDPAAKTEKPPKKGDVGVDGSLEVPVDFVSAEDQKRDGKARKEAASKGK